jgi:hypothetical protein
MCGNLPESHVTLQLTEFKGNRKLSTMKMYMKKSESNLENRLKINFLVHAWTQGQSACLFLLCLSTLGFLNCR